MSWMSPLTVPITILPTRGRAGLGQQRAQDAMPAFMALAASSTSGTNRMPSRKSMPTIRMPSTSASVSTLVRGPAALEQDVDALLDLLLEAVIEVVVHLLHQLVIIERAQIEFFFGHHTSLLVSAYTARISATL